MSSINTRSVVINMELDGRRLAVAPRLPPLVPARPSSSIAVWGMSLRPGVLFALVVIGLVVLMAIAAPWLGTIDPTLVMPADRLKSPSALHWFGTDLLGRDLYSRVAFGARISLLIGISVAILTTLFGTAVGIAIGFSSWLDMVLMRLMDGIMSIPTILFAIALIALTGGSVTIVILAITIAEIPRVARMVRGVVLSIRQQTYIESAIVSGATMSKILLRHILPNSMAPVVVHVTYVAASAMIIEASLSFIGAGTPTIIPSWGNIMSEGRAVWQLKPFVIFFPALFLSITVLSINILGDALRDALDPRQDRMS